MLEVSSIAVAYGDVKAVWDVSLAVEPGHVAALLGRNGAGKTTTLRAVSGLQRCAQGSIVLDGQDITATPVVNRVRNGIAMVQENKRIFRQQSVEENLIVGGYPTRRGRRKLKQDLESEYARFPILAEKRHDRAGSLSGGQQQMLAISQALMARPRVLLLDEPSAGLAPIIMDDVMAAVAALKSDGLAIVLVEQLVDRALSIADSVCVIDQGRVVGSGPTEQFSAEVLHQLYLGSTTEAVQQIQEESA